MNRQKIKETIEEKLELVVKGLLGFILLLVLIIIILVYKRSDEAIDVLENQLIDELMIEQDSAKKIIDQEDVAMEVLVDQKVMVDVKGAVEAPGVYEMEADSRVIDCIEKAGGFLIDAEQKRVNLAQRAEDQMVIYIPMKDEEISDFEQLLPDKPVSQTGTNNGKVDLNKATKEELKSLNGIGDTKAESIILFRETNGFFEKVEDIKNVSGIGEATFEKLREEIQVTP